MCHFFWPRVQPRQTAIYRDTNGGPWYILLVSVGLSFFFSPLPFTDPLEKGVTPVKKKVFATCKQQNNSPVIRAPFPPPPPHADNFSTSLGGLIAGSNPCAVLGYKILR